KQLSCLTMRCITAAAPFVIGLCLVSSCSTVGLMIGDAPVSGRIHDVSVNDIKRALVAARNAPENRNGYEVCSIEVRTKDEIYLYTNPDGLRFDSVRREKNGWSYQSGGLVLKHFVPTRPY